MTQCDDLTGRSPILVERRDSVGVVLLNRPHRHNALTPDSYTLLRRAFEDLGRDRECRAVVLAGRGNSFCSGMDMSNPLQGEGPGSVQAAYAAMREATALMLTIREIPQPVIAAVQGHAIGIGFALAAGSDIRIAAADAQFHASFVRIGMTPGDVGLSWFLPRLIGQSATAELFYTGATLDAARANQLGLVSRVVADPLDNAIALATQIASSAPLAVRITKELLNGSLGMSGFREHLEVELRSQVLCALTGDAAEARAAFAERRTPQFKDL